MKRTNITFDDDTYEYLRKKSFEDRKSMDEILREMVREQMTPEKKQYPDRITDKDGVINPWPAKPKTPLENTTPTKIKEYYPQPKKK